ncbi:unnamed protein product, partial [Protopolystoma xenopodis]
MRVNEGFVKSPILNTSRVGPDIRAVNGHAGFRLAQHSLTSAIAQTIISMHLHTGSCKHNRHTPTSGVKSRRDEAQCTCPADYGECSVAQTR